MPQGENRREGGPCVLHARNGKSHQPCGIGASRTRNNRIAQWIYQHADEKERRTDSELEVESGAGSILSAWITEGLVRVSLRKGHRGRL